MKKNSLPFPLPLPFLLIFISRLLGSTQQVSSESDIITAAQRLKDPGILVSRDGTFKFGFFSPQNSTNRYVGIWYNNNNNFSATDVVWTANRDTPLNDSSGVLQLSKDGNLLVIDGSSNKTLWSSNITSSTANNTSSSLARILDSGNLVLLGGPNSKTYLWQSFDHPTNSFLPDMKLSFSFTQTPNSGTGTSSLRFLNSWKTPSDISNGEFSLGIDSFSIPQLVIRTADDRRQWRSGPWNGNMFIGVEDDINSGDVISAGFILATDRRSTMSLTFTYSAEAFLSYYALSYDGNLILKWWDGGKRSWVTAWQALADDCDVYGRCGAFASCNPQGSRPICSCFRGFDPKNKAEWGNGNWTSGCVRRTKLECGANSSSSTSTGEDGFWIMERVKVPDKADWVIGLDQDECQTQCLRNCSCLAYVYDTGAGCLSWSTELLDTVELSGTDGLTLNIRLAYSDLDTGANRKRWNNTTPVAIGVPVGAFAVVVFILFILGRWRARRRGYRKESLCNILTVDTSEVQVEELPLFKLEKLLMATNNFNLGNKLGQGGFGPVYRGTLEDGQQVAVKRLLRGSGQGLQEFMNEVVLISKLQHRNLVRLIGCCGEAEEKILVYEYMPNKSLDALLFDPVKKQTLDWKKRLNIIHGISRGLLYLHRDSRLKIIHRDLKASNILLDEDLNPRISDFGMARIFGGNQDQENTRRVVGTYGYMAPEYAMEGRFSEKSDVFSFGVLLLEIIAGRKNSSFWYDEESLSLLGYAWKLWNEDNVISLTDPLISETCNLGDILKCIQVGLLCVQEFAKERPSISKVIKLLGGNMGDIPLPNAPGFTLRKNMLSSGEGSSSQQAQQRSGSDDDSMSILSGR